LLGLGYETWAEEWKGNDSQMHGCMNGIGGWFQRGLAGIRADAPGYKKITIRPAVVGDLAWVKAHHDSPYGRIACEWRRDGERLAVEVEIPVNTTAVIYLPVVKGAWEESEQALLDRREEEGRKVVVVGSGRYVFRAG
jgi:alpha-L-rhamnosidase